MHGGFEWTFGNIVIGIIVVVCLLGILAIVLQVSEVKIPPWLWKIAGIALLGFVAILAIKFLLSL